MRRPVKNRNIVGSDLRYNSTKVEKFINSLMWSGKKSTARKVVYDAFDIVKEKTKTEDPLEIFETALRNVGPQMEVRSRRIGGANYQVPREVRPERKQALAFRWILTVARGGKRGPMAEKLAAEIIAAANNEGSAVKKKEDTHKMAESNKAFAHFAW
ncbi:30S ribosomal protein S7 [Candidatus Adlerbacteria bacterium RIFCSPHIGHO2_01_FULL_54_23]|uniref:Small ribosomal subunit protein uS7 n=1 Tax=Candidatus Adlerbacteria bacterium GW2011_GWA1_54_10 TaxID=1618605 RepID=A0A0G2A516_9BACT|nr:MAG: 30S ribosomal protein S7 [Candidatus Adlerbacteria bacterium GW2011_GWA1_54_10]KKW36202.1 MAG: 30S ribosomal protein S7 [Candidatus Adlerbacteria bacterium GW2011_GWA2_54_12]OGC79444.1 MAG: 30S ribosomal protein S7 [Candidatus Adlerbacteria bacterium RIFCSPHIGHO2_01_FULL_54_23]